MSVRLLRPTWHRWLHSGTRPTTPIATRPHRAPAYAAGQPTHETRQHYLPTPGNITPGISAQEYYERRLRLARDMQPNSVAIVAGNSVQHSLGAVFYPFQQNNDLYYLSGWLEPDSVVAVERVGSTGTEEDVVFHMIVPPKTPGAELWGGPKSGTQGAYDYFNADEAVDNSRLQLYLRQLIKRNSVVYFDDAQPAVALSRFSSFFGLSSHSTSDTIRELLLTQRTQVKSLKPILAELRSVKSPGEINVMHRAGQISSRGINSAMARVGLSAPFATEKTLARYLEFAFVRGGCDREAYVPVVASGPNALVIHYTRNDDLLYKDETVFIDAGGKLGGYCADISRAWPNRPQGFSPEQRDIYDAVLDTNRACIAVCAEQHGMSLQSLHELAVTRLTQNLRNITGFGSVSRSQVASKLFPHYIGHHLGLDLHDVPLVLRSAPLVTGNVITIEPGLYIPFDDAWPRRFQGIGVRVEDDIAVGETDATTINLTSLCVKEVADIEALVLEGQITTPGAENEVVEVWV